MYVCLCVALSDRVVRAAVSEGATTVRDLEARFDAGAVCGGCVEELRSVLAEALALKEPDRASPDTGRGEG